VSVGQRALTEASSATEFLSFAATSWAAGVFGARTLSGWTVTKDGEEVCYDPSVDTGSKEIECDKL
jgi:hypothetical protein